MLLREEELTLRAVEGHVNLILYFEHAVSKHLADSQIPIRFVVTKSDGQGYQC